jgi:predicted phage terminase large subunit-like protein
VGARDWSALYQQEPAPESGGQFQRDWFSWYDPDDLPKNLNSYGASDYAVTVKGGDWTEHGVGGVDENGELWFTDWWSGQEAPDVTIEAKLALASQHKVLEWYGEKGVIEKAIGPATNRAMRDSRRWVTMTYLPTTGDKIARVASFRARAQAGAVHLPRGKRWAEDLVLQLCSFPAGKHDDKVDVCGLFGRAMDSMADARPAEAPRKEPPTPFTDPWFAARDNADAMSEAERARYYR